MSSAKQFCEHCGYELPLDSQFCENCGKAVSQSPVPPAAGQGFTVGSAPSTGGRSKKWMAFGFVGALVAGLILCVAAGVLGVYLFRSSAQVKNATEAVPLTEVLISSATAAPQPTLVPVQATPTIISLIPAQPTAIFLPVSTVTPFGKLTFASHGISFDYDPSLGTDFDIVLAEEQSGGAVMEWEALPQHLELIIRGYPYTESSMQARIAFFPVEDYYRVNPTIGDNHANLQQMLMMRRTDDLPDPLPFFPFWDAGQVIAVKVAYLDFANGSGVRYLTQYASDVYPINNMGLFYTFQGLTDDGKTLVSAVMPVSNPILPDPQIILADPAFYDEYETYLSVVTADLMEQPDNSYTPSLELLDELFASLIVENVR